MYLIAVNDQISKSPNACMFDEFTYNSWGHCMSAGGQVGSGVVNYEDHGIGDLLHVLTEGVNFCHNLR